MTGHIREISRHARVGEFFTSESGEMSAHRSAQIGAVFGAAAVVGAMMTVAQPAEANGTPCDPSPDNCPGETNVCRGLWCGTTCSYRCTTGLPQCIP